MTSPAIALPAGRREPAPRPARIAHVITGLQVGGAESMLHKLLAAADRGAIEPTVISLTAGGPVEARIRELGIEVRTLGMSRRLPSPFAALRLARWLRKDRIDVVQTWMYHADLVGGLAAKAAGIPVVWGLRHGELDPGTSRPRTVWIQRLCARLSHRVPVRIVSCSEQGLRIHQAVGYAADRLLHIPNGFELDRFAPSADHRAAIRAELGIALDAPVVGVVGRFHPAKDHATFLRAAAIVARAAPGARFVLVGLGVDGENPELARLCRELELVGRVHLLGRRSDVERIDAALDVACSSSVTEGFSNVIGEAMACAVPCVVTDVGDSASIVGDTGLVVPPAAPEALAAATLRLLQMPVAARAALGAAARRRVQEHFDIRAVARRFEELHLSLVRW